MIRNAELLRPPNPPSAPVRGSRRVRVPGFGVIYVLLGPQSGKRPNYYSRIAMKRLSRRGLQTRSALMRAGPWGESGGLGPEVADQNTSCRAQGADPSRDLWCARNYYGAIRR